MPHMNDRQIMDMEVLTRIFIFLNCYSSKIKTEPPVLYMGQGRRFLFLLEGLLDFFKGSQ